MSLEDIYNRLGYLKDEKGNLFGVRQADNKPRVSSMDYKYDIAEGNIPGHASFFKLGFNGDVGTSEEDV